MGALEDLFRHDQDLHREEDSPRRRQTGEPLRSVFHWRLETPKASKALLILRYFPPGNVVTTISQPGHFTFSEDFQYAFSVVCGYFDLNPQRTACFERFTEKRIHCHRQRYIQFRMTQGSVSREIISGFEFDQLLNQLSQWK